MNVPIIQGVKEPGLGDNENTRLDNEDYNKPLNVSLEEQKQGVLDMYKTKPDETVTDKENIVEATEISEQERKIEENPDSPLIDSFVSQGLLETDEGEFIKEALLNTGDIEEKISSVEGLNPETQKQIVDAIKFLNGPEAKAQSVKKFNKDFDAEITGLEETVEGGKKGEKELSGKNKELIDLLGGNYFNLDGGEETNKEALDRAFKTSLNQLMDGKSFRRPDTFDNMLNTIRNSKLSFTERFDELKKVDTLIDKDQSRANNKLSKAYQKTKQGAEKQNQTLEEKFNNFKETVKLAKDTANKEALADLLIEADELKEEANASGDIFVASDLDILLKEIQEVIPEVKPGQA